ncbi:GlxA family transcriptional regulator [Methylobacterium nodulans]|uniref:Transcriptional regulator, AraC family n=1 Tax=Methylobacterium nodulans (strain LMG 21967 / CNCM I-2342 / ORS 2060) TaxID=460265 RepID=B8II04_METNO|nr:GlxA family transcriptional regulator [Methylobacterium nodulans]ACL56042.1 transcriptional regulator, AraC family [Methylobacterium nodulans ORS 2060]
MRSVAFLLFPGFQMMSLAAVTAFELANAASGDAAYTVNFLSETGGPVASSIGAAVETQPFGEAHHDTVVVVGELSAGLAPAGFIAGVQAASRRTRRIAGICTGAFPLAQAGLLDGRRATTHWAYARALQRLYPAVKVEEDRIFIADGPVWTSAGMTAAIDLALALIEEDLGRDMSRALARKLVVYHRRSGGQSQFSALLELEPKSDRIQSALTYARRNLRNPLSVEELAEAAHLSPRQFSRVFRAETGQSPAKAVENLRLEAARAMMEDGRHAIDVVARETGFADRERMRRAFLRAFGQPPQVIRRSARAEEIRAA